jgi:hypothetical protein
MAASILILGKGCVSMDRFSLVQGMSYAWA